MTDDKNIHRKMGAKFSMQAWKLLDIKDRTDAETLELVHAVHASLAHWLIAGGPIEEVRGLWHISRVYSELGDANQATRYANLCQNLTDNTTAELKDFDHVYAIEAQARAHAISGNEARAKDLKSKAYKLADAIAGDKDRQIVLADLAAGNWGALESTR